MSTSDSGRISVYCPCGAKLKVAREHLGRKAKCPKCAEVFTLQTPDDSDSGTFELSPPDPQNDLMAEVAAAAERAPTAESTTTSGVITCSNCGQKHPRDARICVHCGFDSAKGRVVKAPVAATESDGFLVSIARRLGAFGLGCALSTGGALIGAGVWFAVAVITDYEIGYIAWALGLLAGGGMAIGYRDRNARAGATAALISAGGIVAAKLAIFLYVNAADISAARAEIAQIGSESQLNLQAGSAEVVGHRVEQEALRNHWSWDSQYRDTAYEAHGDAVAELTDEELAVEIAKVKAWNDGDKWNDRSYTTNFMIMHYAQQSWEDTLKERGEDPNEVYEGPGKREWTRLVHAAREKVEAIEPQERTTLAKDVAEKNELQAKSAELADEVVAIRAVRDGISPHDQDARIMLRKEVIKSNESMTIEQVTAAMAENETWKTTGRWDDIEFLRKDLAFKKASVAATNEMFEHMEDEDYDWNLPNQQWATFYENATEKVDPLTDTEVVAATKQFEDEAESRQRELIQRIRQGVTNRATKSVMSFFFENYFGGMDLLFGLFALATAWKIASGGSEQ